MKIIKNIIKYLYHFTAMFLTMCKKKKILNKSSVSHKM